MACVFLDMDEVIADFTGAALAVHGWSKEKLEAYRTPGHWDITSPMRLHPQNFWTPIALQGAVFWENLQPLPWAQDVLDLMRKIREWYLVTSPAPECGQECYAGKMKWIQKHLGKSMLAHCHFTPHKHLFAKVPKAVLIDDKEENIDRFESHGGSGILFPSMGNSMYSLASDPVYYVRHCLERINAFDIPKR